MILTAALGAAACAAAPPPPPARLDPEAEATASARSFIQCLERSGAECRHESGPYREWAALRMLAFIRDGSPVALLSRLGSMLRELQDDVATRKAFVAELTAAESKTRDAACDATGVGRLDAEGARPLIQQATARAERLGLPALDPAFDLPGIVAMAEPMGEARVVEITCQRTRSQFFLLLGPYEGGFRAVALETRRPTISPTAPAFARIRLRPPDDVVSPYIPVAEDGL